MNKFVKSMLSLALAGSMAATVVPGVAMGETLDTKYVDLTGTVSGDLNARGRFYADYSSLDEALEAGNRLHLQMASEGQVLLKNENGALPLGADERNVTFLGIGSVDYNRGGGGSGATKGTSYMLGWYDAFEQAGFHVNPKTVSMYENLFQVLGGVHETNDSGKLLEPSMSYFSKSVTSTFASYNDVAVVCFSRFGRENMDLATNSVEGHSDPNDHYLQLDDNELELIKLAKANFKKVVVMINSSNIMQIPELNAPVDTEYGVDAILWVGGIGDQGTLVAANILTGEVNPSGHTVDIWPSDFTKDPTFTNFSDMSQNVDEEGNRMDAWLKYEDGTLSLFCDTEFREGIYYGYRYYETKAHDDADGESWYQEAVTYPFGYGLSYTTFDWELAGASDPAITAANQVISVSVKVTNTGSVAGKDVVELYAHTPYYNGGIEKAEAVLVGYAKTKLLQPGESDTVTIEVTAQDMASYDWDDANNNGFAGYELEAGTYGLAVQRNSHDIVFTQDFTVASGIQCKTDLVTGAEIKNVYEDDFTTVRDDLLDNMISRATGLEQPAAQTAEERVMADWEAAMLDAQEVYYPYMDEEGQPWYVSEVPEGWTQGAETTVRLADLAGKTYTEPTVIDGVAIASEDENSKLWDSYMNSLTWEELVKLFTDGDGGKDGPVQFGGTCWQSTPIAAATWNIELLEEQGKMYGNQALLVGLFSWRGPGTNIHRSPFNGRTFEYYSEDPFLTASMAAVIVDGCQSKGVSCFAKHMFANVQEYNRADYGGVCTFATEQVFREIYQRSFEWMVKYGHTNGMMTSFNRVGYVVNSNNWAVHEELLRNEWGFTGATVDDAWAKDFVSCDLMLRAGDDTLMGSDTAHKCYVTVGQWDASLRDGKGDVLCPTEDGDDTFESTTHYYAMRKSAQRIQQAKVNSNQYKNFASDFELTATVSYGLANAAQIACAETTDFNVTLAEGQELPAGMTASGFVVSYGRPILGQYQPGDAEYKTGWTADNNIYGEYPAQGTYEVLVDIECDGYISAQNVKLTINVVSPYTVNGEVLAAANGENPVVTVKSGEQTELVITSETLAYQAFLTTGGFMPKEITNWYVMNGSRYLRNEEKTHADGVTIAIEDAEEKHEMSYDIEGSVPGMEAEKILSTAYGLRTKKAITVNDGIKLTGIPTTPGTYTVTVTQNVPWAPAMTGIWLMPAMGGELTFTQAINIVVE